jgi:hypothetical protein
MSKRMEWEGGPILVGLKHMIDERECREKHLQEVLDSVQRKLPFPWEDDEAVEEMLKKLQVETGISFSSWIV